MNDTTSTDAVPEPTDAPGAGAEATPAPPAPAAGAGVDDLAAVLVTLTQPGGLTTTAPVSYTHLTLPTNREV